MYDSERADARALEQLESILRDVAEELSTWRARALKAEADPKGRGTAGGGSGGGGSGGSRTPELDAENRALRQRVEAARTRVQGLLARLSFLEEQSRTAVGGGSAG